jgi:hypothetical protein
MGLQFKYPIESHSQDWKLFENYITGIVDSMPNKGILSDEEKELMKEHIANHYPNASFSNTSLDYGYLGRVPYVEDGNRFTYAILIASSEATLRSNGVNPRKVNILNLLWTDLDDGELLLHIISDDESVATTTVHLRKMLSTQYSYNEYLKEVEKMLPDQDLHGILNI